MIKFNSDYKRESVSEMFGGSGAIGMEHIFDCETEMASPTRLFSRLTLEKGCSVGYHEHHGEEEVFYILKGVAELNDNGEIATLNAGDTIITSNAGHSLTNIGEETLEVLAVIVKFA